MFITSDPAGSGKTLLAEGYCAKATTNIKFLLFSAAINKIKNFLCKQINNLTVSNQELIFTSV